MLTSNPNAEVAVYTGAATIILVWVLGDATGVAEIPTFVAQAITVLLTGLVLLAGRKRRA
jgi:hypothetical protein